MAAASDRERRSPPGFMPLETMLVARYRGRDMQFAGAAVPTREKGTGV